MQTVVVLTGTPLCSGLLIFQGHPVNAFTEARQMQATCYNKNQERIREEAFNSG